LFAITIIPNKLINVTAVKNKNRTLITQMIMIKYDFSDLKKLCA